MLKLSENAIYGAVVGSPVYNLKGPASDDDFAFVKINTIEQESFRKNNQDFFMWTPEEFIAMRKTSMPAWVGHQLLFPYEFFIENDLSRWIKENREEMIKAMLPEIYDLYINSCKYMARRKTIYHKRVALAIHFQNLLVDYANGMTFAEALKSHGVHRDFLLSVRSGKAPISQIQAVNTRTRKQAMAVAGFYAEPKANPIILDEFKHMVHREAELLDYKPVEVDYDL